MRLRTILLFGAPGSGKGTQGKIPGSIPGFWHFPCRDVFRAQTPIHVPRDIPGELAKPAS
jgi:adenylate kinase